MVNNGNLGAIASSELYRTVKTFEETGSVFDIRKSNSGRRKTGQSKGIIEEVMEVIEETPKMSVRTVLSNKTSVFDQIYPGVVEERTRSTELCGSNKMELRLIQPMLPWTDICAPNLIPLKTAVEWP